jgi:hypothetical protein
MRELPHWKMGSNSGGYRMKNYNNPSWWTKENDSAWDRTKAAFKRDWDQTKHDFGGKEPDTNQNVNDTVKQAAGKEPIPPRRAPNYEDAEPALRFGYGARAHYRNQYPKWNSDVENQLKRDWTSANPDVDWNRDRDAIHRAWDYDESSLSE